MSGLITGQDLVSQLKEKRESGADLGTDLYIPSNMLRVGEEVFLDDWTIQDAERELGLKVTAVESGGKEFVEAMLNSEYAMERDNGNFVYIQAFDRQGEVPQE